MNDLKKFRWFRYRELENGKVEIYENGKLIHTAESLSDAMEAMQSDLIY